MAITHVGSTKVSNTEGGDVLDPSVDLPAGVVEGDLIILVASIDGDANTISLPAGFSSEFNGEVPNSAIGPNIMAVGWKVASASEPSAYTVTFGTLDGYGVTCSAFTGVDAADAVNVGFAFNNASGETIPETPSITIPAPGDVLLTIATVARGAGFSEMDFDDHYTPPGGHTEIVEVNHGGGTDYSGHAVGFETMASSGASGTRTWTCFENDDGGLAGAMSIHIDTGASVFFEADVDIEVTSGGVFGSSDPIGHVETVTGNSSGTGTISLAYPAGIVAGQVAIAAISADDGTKPVSVPSGFTSLAKTYGVVMEETIRRAAGKISGDISPSYAETVYAGGRTGATYLCVPVFNGNQILWQDAAGTVPADTDGDPIRRLDDVSGLGNDAIQDYGSPSFFLRFDGTNYWIEVTESDDRPIMPVGAISGNTSTIVMGLDQTVASRTVLLSTASSSSGFLFVALDGSTSTTMYSEVSVDAIRTDTTGDMADYGGVPVERDDNHTLYTESEIITFQGVEFTSVWTSDGQGVYLLGYSAGGWAIGGKFYGMAIVDGDGFQSGVPRGDGSLAFTPDVGYRVIDGTEGANADFTHDAGEEAVATLSIFDLVDVELGPLDASMVPLTETGTGGATLDDDRQVAAIETATDGAVIVHVITNGQATTGHTPPEGVIEIADVSEGTGEDGTSIAVGWEQLRQAGVYPSKQWEIATENITPYRTYAIALRPLYEPVSLFNSSVLLEVDSDATMSLSIRLAGDAEAVVEASGNLGRATQFEGDAEAAVTAASSLGSMVGLDGSVEIEAAAEASQIVRTALGGDALVESEASATTIIRKRLLQADADIAVETDATLDRGTFATGELSFEVDTSGLLGVKRGLVADVEVTGTTVSAFRVKRRFMRGRVTVAGSSTGAFIRYAMFSASPVIDVRGSARLTSFKEVFFDSDVTIEVTAQGAEPSLLAVFSEDVVAIGLATIINDFGGVNGRRTIKLNPSDRTFNVGQHTGH